MPTIEAFKGRYPEFERADDNTIGFFIEDAKQEIDERQWSHLYCRGVLALTAHFIAMRKRVSENAGGPIALLASESVGELSASYAIPPNGGEAYHLTAYGQEYLRLRNLVGVGVMVV
ncbi:DUF4054 domain-containing protein [Avibacterium paragallinarum]|uniref:DUF4054 domain-containing protein n=1 Tax=Avibacterium paragallinarum TaxID=728 RepID=UPI003985E805